MNLYLMRHAPAVERADASAAADLLRPLTTKGLKRVRHIAQAFLKMEISFDTIVSSPAVRTVQTGEALAHYLPSFPQLTVSKALAPPPHGNLPAQIRLLHQLQDTCNDVLWIGHEPQLSRLATRLMTGTSSGGITFKKAGVAKFYFSAKKSGSHGVLEWLLTPKQLEQMG